MIQPKVIRALLEMQLLNQVFELVKGLTWNILFATEMPEISSSHVLKNIENILTENNIKYNLNLIFLFFLY